MSNGAAQIGGCFLRAIIATFTSSFLFWNSNFGFWILDFGFWI